MIVVEYFFLFLFILVIVFASMPGVFYEWFEKVIGVKKPEEKSPPKSETKSEHQEN